MVCRNVSRARKNERVIRENETALCKDDRFIFNSDFHCLRFAELYPIVASLMSIGIPVGVLIFPHKPVNDCADSEIKSGGSSTRLIGNTSIIMCT